jgi:CheY-like chemotaxis protein
MEMNARVLLVDDHSISRHAMSEYLHMLGFSEVDCVSNGSEALDTMVRAYEAGRGYDIVFTDRSMPVMDGMALLQACRADRRFAGTALVILSGETESRAIVEALRCGATSYMVKPVSLDTFRQTISSVEDWIAKARGTAIALPDAT